MTDEQVQETSCAQVNAEFARLGVLGHNGQGADGADGLLAWPSERRDSPGQWAWIDVVNERNQDVIYSCRADFLVERLSRLPTEVSFADALRAVAGL